MEADFQLIYISPETLLTDHKLRNVYILNERKNKIKKLERSMLTNRNNDKVIFNKFTECHSQRPGMAAVKWSKVWHFFFKVKLKFLEPDGG